MSWTVCNFRDCEKITASALKRQQTGFSREAVKRQLRCGGAGAAEVLIGQLGERQRRAVQYGFLTVDTNSDGNCSTAEFASFYQQHGVGNYILYEDSFVYGDTFDSVAHGALNNGTCASSKLGMGIGLNHFKSELEGETYGNALN